MKHPFFSSKDRKKKCRLLQFFLDLYGLSASNAFFIYVSTLHESQLLKEKN